MKAAAVYNTPSSVLFQCVTAYLRFYRNLKSKHVVKQEQALQFSLLRLLAHRQPVHGHLRRVLLFSA